MRREDLLERMDAIGRSVAACDGTLLLLALGSIGLETDRLDDYSDLDFFLIVEDGQKARFIDELDWLEVAPLAYQFQNTKDGHKVMYADGIYGEFAVFELHEMASIAYTPGRIIWQRDEALETFATPKISIQPTAAAYCYEEALTNLYVGLLRERRGERLAGFELIQVAAVTNVLKANGEASDPFNPTRRVEVQRPEMIVFLEQAVLGYGRSVEAAEAILVYIAERHPVNATLKQEIERLLRA
ncbi:MULTISPECIES: hypothetical protein [Exiguobacterium]|uniref:hypothetical protein n=1 Tax=Exiguobacterium TaxID=33986 RepID=UPI002036D71D|nr:MULTISPECIES: hypothetical protein [Exiguobacterium]MCT4782132.1 hypothetical protein [Exiguobacterium himgiriensis]